MKNFFLSLLLITTVAGAQNPAALDPTFNVFPLPAGAYFIENPITKVVRETDGKLLILEQMNFNMNKLFRFDNGIMTHNFSTAVDGSITHFVLQPDGKIILGGNFTTFNGNPCNKIIRINADGSLDGTFNSTYSFYNIANVIGELVLQPDGKVIATAIPSTDGDYLNIRLNANGSNDAGFIVDEYLQKMSVQPDGKIIGMRYSSATGITIRRLNTNGSIDGSFISGTGPNSFLGHSALVLQPDGKILAGGSFTTYNDLPANQLVRLHPDGSLDTSFNSGSGFSIVTTSAFTTPEVRTINVQSDGKIIVGGYFTGYQQQQNAGIVRLNADGSKDLSYNIGDGAADGAYNNNRFFLNTFLQPDGKLIYAGAFDFYKSETVNNIVRINVDGTRDITLTNICRSFDDLVSRTLQLSSGKIIAFGQFNAFNGETSNTIARLNHDGSLDTSFSTGSGYMSNPFFEAQPRDVAEQPDGKLVVAAVGDGTDVYNGSNVSHLFRLNTDGSLDTSLNLGVGFNDIVSSVVVQPDGKIIAAGRFTSYQGVPNQRVVRLLPDGSIDPSFNFVSPPNTSAPYDLLLQQDGKTIVALNEGLAHLVRANPDGSTDTSFVPASSLVNPILLCKQTDGKILVCHSDNATALRRLHTNGDIDDTFMPPTDYNNASLRDAEQDANGKIVVWFNYKLQRLNADGSVDATFNMPIGFDHWNASSSFLIQTDGKIVASGHFKNYEGQQQRSIVRLLGGSSLSIPEPAVNDFFSLYPNPADNVIHIQSRRNATLQSAEIYDLLGQKVLELHANTISEGINTSGLQTGTYIVRINSDIGIMTSRFIKK